MKKFFVRASLIAGALLPFASFAEDPPAADSAVSTALTGWIGSAQATLTSVMTALTPLFGVGITILLMVLAWRLFKRTTKSAT